MRGGSPALFLGHSVLPGLLAPLLTPQLLEEVIEESHHGTASPRIASRLEGKDVLCKASLRQVPLVEFCERRLPVKVLASSMLGSEPSND